MAEALRCDRCGTFFEAKGTLNIFDGLRFETLCFRDRSGQCRKNFDFCDECKLSYIEFMKKPGYFKGLKGNDA